MVDATVFVAVAIGSVLGLLLLSVTLMYCMKRHHDKQQNRELIERRRLEERHHRHLVSLRVAQPPPYDSRRENVLTMVQGPVPFSPPPAYKERITPLPPRNGQDGLIVGIGGTTGYGAPPIKNIHGWPPQQSPTLTKSQ